jgi:hypothetical protein
MFDRRDVKEQKKILRSRFAEELWEVPQPVKIEVTPLRQTGIRTPVLERLYTHLCVTVSAKTVAPVRQQGDWGPI